MSATERRKGVGGEQEVATLLRSFNIGAERVPNSGGLSIKGDLTGVDGYHFEVKRCETLRVPAWLAQAHEECGDAVPVVAFRTSRVPRAAVTGQWHGILPLNDLARLLSIAQLEAVRKRELHEWVR